MSKALRHLLIGVYGLGKFLLVPVTPFRRAFPNCHLHMLGRHILVLPRPYKLTWSIWLLGSISCFSIRTGMEKEKMHKTPVVVVILSFTTKCVSGQYISTLYLPCEYAIFSTYGFLTYRALTEQIRADARFALYVDSVPVCRISVEGAGRGPKKTGQDATTHGDPILSHTRSSDVPLLFPTSPQGAVGQDELVNEHELLLIGLPHI